MTQEEIKAFEQALNTAWKSYVDRGAATVDALEDNTQELAFAKGLRQGMSSINKAIKMPLIRLINGCLNRCLSYMIVGKSMWQMGMHLH